MQIEYRLYNLHYCLPKKEEKNTDFTVYTIVYQKHFLLYRLQFTLLSTNFIFFKYRLQFTLLSTKKQLKNIDFTVYTIVYQKRTHIYSSVISFCC